MTCDRVVFTLIYTKTTDTAGSGQWTPQGVPAHHYSEDEQVVGTWIDGSTVYEKVIDLGTNTNIDYQSWTLSSIINNEKRAICYCALYNLSLHQIKYIKENKTNGFILKWKEIT